MSLIVKQWQTVHGGPPGYDITNSKSWELYGYNNYLECSIGDMHSQDGSRATVFTVHLRIFIEKTYSK